MEQLKATSQNTYEDKSGIVSIKIEWTSDKKVILTVSVKFLFINFTKQWDLTNLF